MKSFTVIVCIISYLSFQNCEINPGISFGGSGGSTFSNIDTTGYATERKLVIQLLEGNHEVVFYESFENGTSTIGPFLIHIELEDSVIRLSASDNSESTYPKPLLLYFTPIKDNMNPSVYFKLDRHFSHQYDNFYVTCTAIDENDDNYLTSYAERTDNGEFVFSFGIYTYNISSTDTIYRSTAYFYQ